MNKMKSDVKSPSPLKRIFPVRVDRLFSMSAAVLSLLCAPGLLSLLLKLVLVPPLRLARALRGLLSMATAPRAWAVPLLQDTTSDQSQTVPT